MSALHLIVKVNSSAMPQATILVQRRTRPSQHQVTPRPINITLPHVPLSSNSSRNTYNIHNRPTRTTEANHAPSKPLSHHLTTTLPATCPAAAGVQLTLLRISLPSRSIYGDALTRTASRSTRPSATRTAIGSTERAPPAARCRAEKSVFSKSSCRLTKRGWRGW
ncbi:hypothetical protein BU25DRAFT_18812 [Macroventuria anomochaeta]|uniref:Uncharacterized protein n=1 Tax=Macroventuria anomochaeta TaxID=301207 RepID=A0ACB6S5D2_9PLEO|nr:uncharacterized protein BU25DRAFT_18812 [Macroventuria anomochaeta]KAF2629254.1 hypothetical protein BU25DRAFT_18812 [Macroventuria anomochaeta]